MRGCVPTRPGLTHPASPSPLSPLPHRRSHSHPLANPMKEITAIHFLLDYLGP